MTREIELRNEEKYQIEVVRETNGPSGAIRHEVRVLDPGGLPTGETLFGEDNPTFAWRFPSKTPKEALGIFIERIEGLRDVWGYYD